MSLPNITSREQWLVARTELLVREKELTRHRDALNADRRRLPMVEIGKNYVFEGPDGTSFAGISRAPYTKLAAAKADRGWHLDWYSSFGSDFNYDFHATLDPEVAPVVYNFQTPEEVAADPDPVTKSMEIPGLSCFLRDGQRIFHTYSTFARGTDQIGNAYSLLDLTAFGRSENWEEPKGRVAKPHGADPTFTD